MSCVLKVNNCTSYTETEKRIAEYILLHQEEVIYDTAQSFGMKTNTSAAAIIRFSKKLGYKGFTELKVDLAKDGNQNFSTDPFSEKINNDDTLETIINKTKQSDMNSVEETYQLLRIDDLKEAIQLLTRAEHIYLLGFGASGVCCLDFTQKLTRVGKEVVFYQDFHMQFAAMAHLTKNDCVLAISYGGNTKEINMALKFAKKCNCSTIGITQLSTSPMQKYCDTLLYVPKLENDLRLGAVSSRNASLVLTDLLYLGLIRNDLDTYKEKLKLSRNLVNLLRKK